MIGFAEFGRNKELSSKIKKFIALAPVAAVGHIKGAIKVLSYVAPEVEVISHQSIILCRSHLGLSSLYENSCQIAYKKDQLLISING